LEISADKFCGVAVNLNQEHHPENGYRFGKKPVTASRAYQPPILRPLDSSLLDGS
jgi:hypothetical protein